MRIIHRLDPRRGCAWHGHAWEDAPLRLGDFTFKRSRCAHCGAVGPLERLLSMPSETHRPQTLARSA